MRPTTGTATAIALAAALSTAACAPSEAAWPGTAKVKASHTKKAHRAPIPDCATIWKNAATLPTNYKACANWGVTYIAPRVPCVDGTALVAFQATNTTAYIGRTGSTITQVVGDYSSTPEWSTAYAACTT